MVADAHNGNVPGIPAEGGFMAVLTKRPDVYGPLMAATNAIMRAEGKLSPMEREVIAAYASRNAGCSFCLDNHSAIAEGLGSPAVREIIEDPPEQYAALFEFVDAVVAQNVSAEQVASLIEDGHDVEVVEEVIAIASLFGFFTRMTSAYGLTSTPEGRANTARTLRDSYDIMSGDPSPPG